MKLKNGLLVAFLFAAPLPMVLHGATMAGQAERKGPPPGGPMMAMSGIVSDDSSLFVMAGGNILIYKLNDLNTLISKVELPKLEPPTDTASTDTTSSTLPRPRPPMPPGSGLWVKDTTLYVLAGPVIHVYTIAYSGTENTPGLTYWTTYALPKPELPALRN